MIKYITIVLLFATAALNAQIVEVTQTPVEIVWDWNANQIFSIDSTFESVVIRRGTDWYYFEAKPDSGRIDIVGFGAMTKAEAKAIAISRYKTRQYQLTADSLAYLALQAKFTQDSIALSNTTPPDSID